MRGYNIDDYINHKFNKLTLIKNLNKIDKNNSKLASFKCECGNVKELVFTQVLHGEIKSCGCEQGNLSKEQLKSQCISSLKFVTSNLHGITKVKDKYRARIQVHGKSIHLGYFNKLEDAIKARKDAEEKYFKPILDKYNKLD